MKARYCDETLLVYLDPDADWGLKGLGNDHRSVHVAPFAYVSEGNEGQFPPLHWLEGNVAKGGEGRPTVPLPACITGPPLLPSGRAALAGTVKDPWDDSNLRDGVTYEYEMRDCPVDQYGKGQRWVRELTQEENARGIATSASLLVGPWKKVADACRYDFDGYEYFTNTCQSTEGPPHYRVIEGEEVWRKPKSVTSDGVVYGTPEMVSSSCWSEVAEVVHTPVISEVDVQETRSVGCEAGYTGTRNYKRTRTTRSTKFAWDSTPVVTIRYTVWRHSSSSCKIMEFDGEPPICDSDIEVCTPTAACDPITDAECGEPARIGGERRTFVVDVPDTRGRACNLINESWSGTYQETRSCRYEYVVPDDGGRELTGTHCGAWRLSNDGCLKPEPPDAPTNPGDGSCGCGDTTGNSCNTAGGSGGAGGAGGCYLTTAVVEHRGVEADDGPTLTALRHFRDTYMMETPVRRALVWLYYRVAPSISRDLPVSSPAWEAIGRHIDRAVVALEAGDRGQAFRAYWAASVKGFSLWAAFKVTRAIG